MNTRNKNSVLFFLTAISTAIAIGFLGRLCVLIFKNIFYSLSDETLMLITIVRVIAGIFFIVTGFSYISSGFEKKFPFLPFDEGILDNTKNTIYKGMVWMFFTGLGFFIIGDLLPRSVFLTLDFLRTL